MRLLHLASRDADTLRAAVTARMGDLPPELVRSITWSQGIEMARHLRIPADLGAPICLSDAHAPLPRGRSESSNGLLRQQCPNGTDLSHLIAPTLAHGGRRDPQPAPGRLGSPHRN